VIVDIDAASLAELGDYGRWPRYYHAQLIQKLAPARLVGFYLPLYGSDSLSPEAIEIYRREIGPKIQKDLRLSPAQAERTVEVVFQSYGFDEELAQAVIAHGRVYGMIDFSLEPTEDKLPGTIPIGAVYGGQAIPKDLIARSGFKAPSPRLLSSLEGLGFGELSFDPDGALRRQPLLIRYPPGGPTLYPSFALALALGYLGELYPHFPAVDRMELGPHHFSIAPEARLRPLLVSGEFKRFPYSDLLKSRIAPDELKDKIVLVGSSILSFGSIKPNYVREQAMILANLLQGSSISEMGQILPLILSAILGLGIALIGLRYRWPISLMGWLAASALYSFIAILIFRANSSWLELARPLISLFLVFGTSLGYRYFAEYRDMRQAARALTPNLPKERITRLLREGEMPLRLKTKELALIWAELKDFTSLTLIPAREAAECVTELKSELSRVIFEQGGMILQHLPHGLVGLFGYPFTADHIGAAARAGLEMRSSFSLLGPRWLAEGKGRLELGVAIATGIGSAGLVRFGTDWTLQVMGKIADELALLAAWNRSASAQVVLTESTYNQLKLRCRARPLGMVKGPAGQQTVYELLRLEV
jgi:adenylate cyclase